MSPGERGDMTAAAIARLVGVGRAAVSNWRRRYPDFPEPVGGTPSSPRYSRAEVTAWLTATGKAGQLATAGRTDTGTQLVEAAEEPAPAHLTGSELLARAMAALLPPSTALPAGDPDEAELPSVLDPACAHGTRLLAVADRFGDRVRLVGQELREPVAAVAAANLRHHHRCGEYEIRVGDSLLDDHLRGYRRTAAAVVCAAPSTASPADAAPTDPRWEFGSPTASNGELAWVQHCHAHLRPGGVAVVAVSPRTGAAPSGRDIRAALVRSGVLRSVIALPGRAESRRAGSHLWVLQRTGPDQPAVHMVDLSGRADPADVPLDHVAWQQLLRQPDPTIRRDVPRVDLLDGDTTLLPARHVAARAATADELARVTDRLQAVYTRVGRGLPRLAAPASPVRRSAVTISELERVGALTIRSRETTPRAGDVLLQTLGRPPTVATGTEGDDVGTAHVVELDPTRLDAHFVATFLGIDADTLPVANTLGAPSRADLRRCRIPRLPLAEQRRYGETFRRLHELRDALTALAGLSGKVIDQTIHGLAAGALAPDPSPAGTSRP